MPLIKSTWLHSLTAVSDKFSFLSFELTPIDASSLEMGHSDMDKLSKLGQLWTMWRTTEEKLVIGLPERNKSDNDSWTRSTSGLPRLLLLSLSSVIAGHFSRMFATVLQLTLLPFRMSLNNMFALNFENESHESVINSKCIISYLAEIMTVQCVVL